MKNPPDTTRALIEALDAAYPARCILPNESLDDHLRYAGRRQLIDELKAALELQEKQAIRANRRLLAP